MICPNCGNENSNDVSQCTFCGQRFAPKDPQPETQDNAASGNGDYYTSGEHRTEGSSGPDANQQNSQDWNNQNYQNNQGWNNQNYQNNQGWNNQNYQNNQGWNNQNYQNNQGWNNQNYQNNGWNNQQGYPGWQPQPKDPNRGFSLASLIIGIVSIVFLCTLPYLSLPLDIVGLVLGIIALKKPGKKGMAIAGICVNAVILVASIIMLIMVIYIMLNIDQFESFYNDFYNSYYNGLFIQFKNWLFK